MCVTVNTRRKCQRMKTVPGSWVGEHSPGTVKEEVNRSCVCRQTSKQTVWDWQDGRGVWNIDTVLSKCKTWPVVWILKWMIIILWIWQMLLSRIRRLAHGMCLAHGMPPGRLWCGHWGLNHEPCSWLSNPLAIFLAWLANKPSMVSLNKGIFQDRIADKHSLRVYLL